MRRYLAATFSSLRVRNYRLYAFGQTISVSGTWMQKLAQVWLVLVLTDSGLLLGVAAAMQQIPTLLFTNLGGALADRYDKRTILLWTQISAAIPALVLGVLVKLDVVQIWMVMLAALVQGFIDAVDKPARLTVVNELVPADNLTNAVTLNSIIQDSGKIAGPAIAGILIGTAGISVAFFVNAVSFLPVIIALVMIRPRERGHGSAPFKARGNFGETFAYVGSRPELAAALSLMGVAGLLGYNWNVLLPMLSRDTFGGDAATVGFAFTCMGLGAVVGGLAIAGLLKATPRRLSFAGYGFAGLMVLVGLSPSLGFAFAMLFLLGGASVLFRATATSLLQLKSDPQMRGRVISLLVLATAGTTPIGGPIMGWISEYFNARVGCVVGAAGTALAALATYWYLRRRSRDPVPEYPVTDAEAAATLRVTLEETDLTSGVTPLPIRLPIDQPPAERTVLDRSHRMENTRAER